MDDLKNSRALFISGGSELPRRVKARTARQFILHPQQEMIEAPGGSLTVRFKASAHMKTAWYLRMWSDQIEVVAPDALRAWLAIPLAVFFPRFSQRIRKTGNVFIFSSFFTSRAFP